MAKITGIVATRRFANILQKPVLVISLAGAPLEYYIPSGTPGMGVIHIGNLADFICPDQPEMIPGLPHPIFRVSSIESIGQPRAATSHDASQSKRTRLASPGPDAHAAAAQAAPVHAATAQAAAAQAVAAFDWQAQEGNPDAARRYQNFQDIIQRNLGLLNDEPQYNALLRQLNMSDQRSLYFPHDNDPDGNQAVVLFLELFFGRNSHESPNWREVQRLHAKKIQERNRGKAGDVSCVSFLNVTINNGGRATRKCFVSTSGSGLYRNSDLYTLLRDFIRLEGHILTDRSGGIIFDIVDHTGNAGGPEAFDNLIQHTSPMVRGKAAPEPRKACAEKGLVATLTKLIVRYGIKKRGHPNGITVHSSFNISFYPRKKTNVKVGKRTIDVYEAIDLDLVSEVTSDEISEEIRVRHYYFPLYYCCENNCVLNKDAIQFILAIAIKEARHLDLSPIRSTQDT
ncbi:MAG: hypothetical protein K5Q00_01140 [Gammaproteobacteria bacterium]|nr:hypothetical protein [Gammaproteobacteria bacterium]